MGGRGSSSNNGGGGGKGTGKGKGKEILNALLNGKTVTVKNPNNGVVFAMEHLGQSQGKDQFRSTVKENPKNARNPSDMLTPLTSGTTSHTSYDLSKPSEKEHMIQWLNNLHKV